MPKPQPQKNHSLLAVDGNRESLDSLKKAFNGRYELLTAADGEAGLRLAKTKLPDLILLEIALPKLDGIAVCEALRSNDATREIPIIILTNHGELDRRVMSFESGADDFLQKPFVSEELLARIESKLRRVEERDAKARILELGNLILDLNQLVAVLNGTPLKTRLLEFNLLKFLVEHKDEVLSRERILEAVWGGEAVSDRTIDTHIVLLRKKLKGFDHAIATVYGAGYVLKKGRRPQEQPSNQ